MKYNPSGLMVLHPMYVCFQAMWEQDAGALKDVAQ
jgi:hypothetical protein